MKLVRILLSFVIVSLLGVGAFAQDDMSSIKERLKARLPQVDALKIAGKFGENNKGYLEQRAETSAEETEIMNAENADRRALYGIVATRTNATVVDVGVQRAEQIRNASAPAIWLQAGDGTWYKK